MGLGGRSRRVARGVIFGRAGFWWVMGPQSTRLPAAAAAAADLVLQRWGGASYHLL